MRVFLCRTLRGKKKNNTEPKKSPQNRVQTLILTVLLQRLNASQSNEFTFTHSFGTTCRF